MSSPAVTVVAGNPKPASRTLEAARLVAQAVTGSPPTTVIDVIDLGPALLGWGDPAVTEAVRAVAASDLVVVASPTFKATYSGVLKLFLDQFATGDGMAGVTAVPLMLGAGPTHHLAPELLLKPVLVELGAVVPVQGLYLSDRGFAEPDALAPWLGRWGSAITASLAGSHPR
ncbi:NADPH-dependent FMN reductase [Curtobacterium pusillum]|uniref:NADPH-dependent FMN reductase n=1 Tax=Curtobacterium pusillum TaxID=69373 RepID=UPI0011A51500|nr:NAD(P)H-dependent oxidoreductase [Curtobacterium pusillum]